MYLVDSTYYNTTVNLYFNGNISDTSTLSGFGVSNGVGHTYDISSTIKSPYNNKQIILGVGASLGFNSSIYVSYNSSLGNILLDNDITVGLSTFRQFQSLNNERDIIENLVTLKFFEPIVGVSTPNNFYISINGINQLFNTADVHCKNIGSMSTNMIQIALPIKITSNDNISVSYVPGNITNNALSGISTFINAKVYNKTSDYDRLNFDYLKWLIKKPYENSVAVGYGTTYSMVVGSANTSSFFTERSVIFESGDIIIPDNHIDQRRTVSNSGIGIGTFYVGSVFTKSFSDTFKIYKNTSPAPTDMYEKRIGYPFAAIDFDNNPPMGHVILNDNSTQNGIKLHDFILYATSSETSVVLPDYRVIYDLLGVAKRNVLATEFGGYDENQYVDIGYNGNYILDMSFKTATNIQRFDVCATSTNPKSYIVEIQLHVGGEYIPVLYMYCGIETRDYFKYIFDNLLPITAIRIRYAGDYYASGSKGDITISASDTLNDVSAISVSHNRDFSDATDSIFLTNLNSEGSGWAPFKEGVAKYNWDFINNKKLWGVKLGVDTSDSLNYIFDYNSSIMVIGDNGVYKFNNNDNILTKYFSTGVGSEILNYSIHNNVLYVGCSNGNLFKSTNGELFNKVNVVNNSFPIKSMESYSGKLYLGYDYSNTYSYSDLYTYNDTTNVYSLNKTFYHPSINVMKNINNVLYLGVEGNGDIYSFTNSNGWQLSHSITEDGVDAIAYSGINSSIWVGFTNGKVYSAPVNNNGLPLWNSSNVYYNDNYDYLNIYGGIYSSVSTSSGSQSTNFVWLSADTNLTAYYETQLNTGSGITIKQKSFKNIDFPSDYTNGLYVTWRQGTTNNDSTKYSAIDSVTKDFTAPIIVTSPSYIVNDNINFDFTTTSPPSGIGTTCVNATWQGYIMASFEEQYTFYLSDSGGARLYINNSLVVDDFTEHAYSSSGISSGVYNMKSGLWCPIKVQYYNGNGSNANALISLSWQSDNTPRQIIPTTALRDKLTRINDVYEVDSLIYGVSENGNIYQLDRDTLSATNRRVFVKLRDNFGNETPSIPYGTNDNDFLSSNKFIYDFVLPSSYGVSGGNSTNSIGKITQIKTDKTVAYTLVPENTGSLFAPDRNLRQYGFYIVNPYYVATLTRWSTLTALVDLPSSVSGSNGLDGGVSVSLYVKTANTRQDVLNMDWGTRPVTVSTIDGSYSSGSNILVNFDISKYSGKWIMYRIVMSTASRTITPIVHNVTISYLAANSSYYFSAIFNANNYFNGYSNQIKNGNFEYDIISSPTDWYTHGTNMSLAVIDDSDSIINDTRSLKIGIGTTTGSYVYTSFVLDSYYSDKSLILQMNYKSINDLGDTALTASLYNVGGGNTISLSPSSLPNGAGVFNGYFTIPNIGIGSTYQLRINGVSSSYKEYVIDDVYLGPSYSVSNQDIQFKRGLLTANYALNNGDLVFGYTTDNNVGNTFDFSTYTQITPNTIFELPVESSNIRFGMALVSIGTNPVIVDEWAVQLDTGYNSTRFLSLP